MNFELACAQDRNQTVRQSRPVAYSQHVFYNSNCSMDGGGTVGRVDLRKDAEHGENES